MAAVNSAEAKESQMEKEGREWVAERARERAERMLKFEADRERLEKKYGGPLRTDIEVIMMRAKERFYKAKEAIDAGVGDEDEEEEEEEGKGKEEAGSGGVWDSLFKKEKRKRKKGDGYFWVD